MHYKIDRNLILKTENAAKPVQQASSFLNAFISKLDPVSRSIDYGCGKLRYKEAILNTTDSLAVVDSEIQLAREQRIAGKTTTIRKYLQQSNRISAYNVSEFARHLDRYDRAFCINVLSVIPRPSIRRRVLMLIREKLRPGGTSLFVVQYRNSDFTRMRSMANARQWQDGFLIDSLRGFSFYALIPPDRLASLVQSAGFEIVETKLNQGSVYLLGRTPMKRQRAKRFRVYERDNFQIFI